MPGSVDVPRLPGIHAYPIRLNRLRVEPARRVGAPRQLLIYRLIADGVAAEMETLVDALLPP